MEEIIGITLVVTFFNFIGGSVRWIFGSLLALITNRPNDTYKVYLFGPQKSKNRTDKIDHTTANGLLGAAIFFIIATILISFNF